MGQKVHPNGIRPGIVKPWNSTPVREHQRIR